MQIPASSDEWYPVHAIALEGDDDFYGDWTIELTEAEVERIRAVQIEFEACQELLSERMKIRHEEASRT